MDAVQQLAAEHHQQDTEWRAWGAVVVRMRELGVELNDGKAGMLCASLKRWGEEMAALRRMQEKMGKPVETWLVESRTTLAAPLADNDGKRWRLPSP